MSCVFHITNIWPSQLHKAVYTMFVEKEALIILASTTITSTDAQLQHWFFRFQALTWIRLQDFYSAFDDFYCNFYWSHQLHHIYYTCSQMELLWQMN